MYSHCYNVIFFQKNIQSVKKYRDKLDEIAEQDKVQGQVCTTDDNKYNIIVSYNHVPLQLCIGTPNGEYYGMTIQICNGTWLWLIYYIYLLSSVVQDLSL